MGTTARVRGVRQGGSVAWQGMAATLAAVVVAVTPAVPAQAQAQYPTKPLRLIVPFPAGGGGDIVFRLVAQHLPDRLGQPVVVENRPGASGAIGFKAGASAAPDGYTVTGLAAPLVLNPYMMKNPLVDPVKDLAPVTTLTAYSLMLVANASVPAKTLQELVALARQKPGEVTYASLGGTVQLSITLLQEATGTRFQSIPYKGTADQASALAGGQVMTSSLPPIVALPLVKDNRMRPLAYFGYKRNVLYPDIPTVSEIHPGVSLAGWLGFAFPAGTPKEIVDRLYTATAEVLRSSTVRDQITSKGDEVFENTPAQFAALIQANLKQYAQLTKAAGIRPE